MSSNNRQSIILTTAAMAELVDALDSGSSRGNPVDVRVILAAMSKIALVLNGEVEEISYLSTRLKDFDQIIAVDGGLTLLSKMGRTPDVLSGDFDSLSSDELAAFAGRKIKYPVDKDKSDTELAIEVAQSLGATEIVLFAALGRRTDHTLANLFLLSRFPGKLSIETERETLYAVCGFHKQFSRPGQTVSFFSLGESAKGVTTQGLKWDFQDCTVDKAFFSLSNVALGDSFSVNVAAGTLLCVIQNV